LFAQGGEPVLSMLKLSGEVLVLARDKQMRGGLHYACGLGDLETVQAMIICGAEVDAQDNAGYTPLHIAAGYLHEKVISVLMDSGADPSLEDNTGRSALILVETLLRNTPATATLFSKRLAMAAVTDSLGSFMFEEIVPDAIIHKRSSSGSKPQFLVSWMDGFEPIWVDETDISDDLIDEFDRGIERAKISRTIDVPKTTGKHKNTSLIRWEDDKKLSWNEI
jgi:signal recognition particle protein